MARKILLKAGVTITDQTAVGEREAEDTTEEQTAGDEMVADDSEIVDREEETAANDT